MSQLDLRFIVSYMRNLEKLQRESVKIYVLLVANSWCKKPTLMLCIFDIVTIIFMDTHQCLLHLKLRIMMSLLFYMQVDYLFRNCYLKRAEFEGITLLDEDLQNAIRFFQKVNKDSIRQISGVLDRETCRAIQSSFIDPLPIQHIRRRIRRYAFTKYKWTKTNLTYW